MFPFSSARYCGGENQVGGQALITDACLESAWFREIASQDACFFTGGLFENLCLKGILSLRDFSLLVIDEAHHTKKSHVFNRLMKNQFFTLKSEERPKVLSLSATLVEPEGDSDKTVQSILDTAELLSSSVATPIEEASIESLKQITNMPEIKFELVQVDQHFDRWVIICFAQLLPTVFNLTFIFVLQMGKVVRKICRRCLWPFISTRSPSRNDQESKEAP